MKTLTKAQVVAKVKNQGSWTGYIAPSKINEANIRGGWHLGMQVTVNATQVDSGIEPTVNLTDGVYSLDYFVEHFKHANCSKETGTTVKFWEE
ncbi:hypothetical protein COF68_06170 [Bacillus toyonensis]|uniref:hypothetical protein n=1 Tax=Bacillus toyonensis TaxID=155322 RepID=UPI000BFE8A93|nr:hypothetical protein [Bacillus toyonensis]PHE64419.1 hypothetical protein COF68_06170 [Bacillus toyonensis]